MVMLSAEEVLVLAGAICVRCMMSIHPYSGELTPPMFGDYEAQRHWQEVTVNLPLKEWYFDTDRNNLTYWGLDYPPLTAYHSLFLGKIAQAVRPESVDLKNSRGFESAEHKMLMRLSVLLSDVLVFFPAIVAFARSLNLGANRSLVTVVLLSLYPALILVDGGHFQYNSTSLGLMVAAVAALFRDKHCLGSFLFVCALNYKQMELYHAMPFFFFLLGKAKIQATYCECAGKLLKIGSTVVVTFVLIWAPFAFAVANWKEATIDVGQIKQILHRVFPVARGLFEDKVANFWCSLNVAVKLKQQFDLNQLMLMSFGATLAASLPTNLMLLAKPTKQNFLFALVITSLAFFLFSFQVHEKSILLVGVPLSMYLGAVSPDSSNQPFMATRRTSLASVWFACITVYSMLPLLAKDRLAVPTLSVSVCYLLLCHHLDLLEPGPDAGDTPPNPFAKRSSTPKPLSDSEIKNGEYNWCDWLVWTAFNFSLVGCLILGFAFVGVEPPKLLPDLWPLLISVYCFGHFSLFGLFFQYQQVRYFLYSPKVGAAAVSNQKKTN